MPNRIYHITKTNFEKEVLQSDRPVLVDFWATWCGPCQMIAPVIEKLADKYPEFKFCKVDIDEQLELASNYKITAVPTFLIFKDGKLVDKGMGVMPEEDIVNLLRNA